MKIVVFTGGSGSHELQIGLNKYRDEIDVDFIINGYDNGKSTGLIRKVFDGKILGPSDIRKNQLNQFALQTNNIIISNVLSHRFSSENPYEYIINYLTEKNINKFFIDIIHRYFSNKKVYEISYKDMCIANIIYGQLAFEKNNSLQTASDIISKVLKIKNNIIINSDKSLFLRGITENNNILYDEADIVEYNNSEDKINDIEFYDDENDCIISESYFSKRAQDSVESADIIIFSTGTQWSSLIPTYKSAEFRKAIEKTKAKKYFIMNSTFDKDMKGVNSDEIIKIISRYMNINDLNIVIDKSAKEGLNKINNFDNNIISEDFSQKHFYKQNGIKLIESILSDFYKNPNKEDLFLFDWDDTIKSRNFHKQNISDLNIEMAKKLNNRFIISGNSIREINFDKVYAENGINYYENGKLIKTKKEFHINKFIKPVISELKKIKLSSSLISNRENACITIKPIPEKFRPLLKSYLTLILKPKENNLKIKITGKSTIDIIHKNTNKIIAIYDIIHNNTKRVFYIGDEYKNGNDSEIYKNRKELKINFIKINNITDTQLFLKIIKWKTY